MNEILERPAAALRVAIAASDAVRRMGLASLAAAAGFSVAEPGERADILLTDEPERAAAAERAILIGGGTAASPAVAGVLSPDATADQFAAAVGAVAAGLTVRSRDLPDGFGSLPDEGQALLTPRELDVLQAVGNGLSNKAIARTLAISPHTVKFHLEAVFRKLGVSTRAEAVRRGLLGARAAL